MLQSRRSAKGVFGGTSEEFGATGEVEGYACADCGYFEEYLRRPATIDWSRIVGASPHQAKPDKEPYR